MAVRAYDDFGFGLTWLAEPLDRTSHALADRGRVWLIDAVDVPEAVERACALGEPAAVVQLLDRHNRDCAALAKRLGVPHLRLPEALPDTPFDVVPVVSFPGWREVALWWPQRRVLAVAEAVGTNPAFALDGAAGVHPILRLAPPGALRRYAPEHLLVGHGIGLHGPAAAHALGAALDRSRRDLPRLIARLPSLLRRSAAR